MRIADFGMEDLPAGWPRDMEHAARMQRQLRSQVRIEGDLPPLRTVAGIDASYDIQRNLTRAVAVLMRWEDREVLDAAMARIPTTFPYVPGFLSFREIPAILKALGMLGAKPDLLMVDGQGIAHPRCFGIASHLGVTTDIPSIGVAKSRLTGRYAEPQQKKGSASPLILSGEQIGTVLRSKDNVKPLFISPGHCMDNETAVELVQCCLTKYRLPEPTRIADKLSKSVQAEMQKELFGV